MSLEEAIKHLEEELEIKEDWSCVACKEDHQQLLEWLKELQSIKSVEPSEALDYMKSLFECWKNLAEKDNLETKEIELEKYIFKENYDAIKQSLLKTQEQEKVLSIITKKNIDMFELKISKEVEKYNAVVKRPFDILTQEEFDLLKRYLR